jgi:hypothetical protein
MPFGFAEHVLPISLSWDKQSSWMSHESIPWSHLQKSSNLSTMSVPDPCLFHFLVFPDAICFFTPTAGALLFH